MGRKPSQHAYENIRKAAGEIIGLKGEDGLTIREVCAKAGISVGTFYNYFEDKEDLIINRYKSMDKYMEETIAPKIGEDSYKNLWIFIDGYIEFCQQASFGFGKWLLNARLGDEGKFVNNTNRTIYIILFHIIKKGQKDGTFAKDAGAGKWAQMLLTLLRGYYFQYVMEEKVGGFAEKRKEIELWLESLYG